MANETVLDLWLASGTLSDTECIAGTPFAIRMWGPGGPADGDNNAVGWQQAAGGGGECVTKAQASAEPPYTVTLGTAGTSGIQGVGLTLSTDSVLVGNISGELARAKPGGRGIAANPTATAGPGGTGGTGDATFAGAAGQTGTGGVVGGSSAGSLGAGVSHIIPGGPDGGCGEVGLSTAVGPAAGARCAANGITHTAPGNARAVVIYERTAQPEYPYISGVPTQNRDTAGASTRTITLPGSHASGDRLLNIACVSGAGGTNSMTGAGSDWTELIDLANAGSNATLAAYAINSTGTEDTTLTSAASRRSNWITCRVKNARPVSTWEIASSALEATTTINLPSLTYTGGDVPILWVAMLAWDTPAATVLGFPSNFGQRFSNPPFTTAASAIAVCCRRTSSASSPSGSFTVSNALSGRVALLAIPATLSLTAESVAYSFAGGIAVLGTGQSIIAETAQLSFSGANTGANMFAGAGSVAISVEDAALQLVRGITGASAALTVSVASATLTYTSIFTQAPPSRTVAAGHRSGVIRFFKKDPTEVLDYTVDWSRTLASGETLASSSWSIVSEEESSALDVDSANSSDTAVSVWASAGTSGVDYYLVNRVTTSAGRTYERALRIIVENSQAA